jgi:hypothetical protein
MMFYILAILNLTPQCMIEATNTISKIEIKKNFEIVKVKNNRKKSVKSLFKYSWENDNIDSRLIALSWIESRLNVNVRKGDKGKACGTYQIHARYSYPMFRRRKGFSGWKESENLEKIDKECNKLQKTSYSVKTMKKLLNILDNKKLHMCHHNSGVYGKCNSFYKKRTDFLYLYLELSKISCSKNKTPIDVNLSLFVFKTKNLFSTVFHLIFKNYFK